MNTRLLPASQEIIQLLNTSGLVPFERPTLRNPSADIKVVCDDQILHVSEIGLDAFRESFLSV